MSSKHNECANMVSVTETQMEDVIKVFPNPSSGKVNVELLQPAFARIIDFAGTIVFDGNLNAGMNILDLQVLPAGIYITELQGGEHVRILKLSIID
jgi:hypothetical protein